MTTADQTYSLLQTALQLQQTGRLGEAEPLYRQILRQIPNQPDALHLLGLLCKDTGRTADAEKLMRRSLKSEPRQPHVLNNLGNLLDSLGRRRQAFECYKKATAMAPQYGDAWRNLGLTLIEDGRADEAVTALETAARIAPGHIETLLGLGNALQMSGDLDRAADCFEAVLAQQPDNARALHNLGVVLDLGENIEGAIDTFTKAAAADPGRAETRFALGNACARLGLHEQAAAAYRAATQIAPDYAEAHKTLSKLLWETGAGNDFLSSYPAAIAARPQARDICVDYAGFLLQSGRAREAEEVLRQAMSKVEPDATLWRLTGRALASLGRMDEARQAFKTATRSDRSDVAARNDLARFLIADGDYAAALAELEAAEQKAPLDQQLWAYRALAWRLAGDPRGDWLGDTENLVRPMKLKTPENYTDSAAFNLALKDELEQLHRHKVHPIDQTLTGGTQTEGSLFGENSAVIQAFKKSLELSVRAYINSLPKDKRHPFLRRKSKDFKFAGSWSVRLHEGHHINHVHPEGWISSAYYVSLPERVKQGAGEHEGWIKFGESNLALGQRENIARMIQPEEGLLVLFPSYMWHGTIPFSGDEPRLTIAFDVVPA